MTIDVAKDRIPMSQRERDLLKIMAPVLEGTRTQAEAARLADLSVRQVRRLQRRLEQDGEGVLVHGLRGKPSNRRLDATMRRQVLDAYRQRFADFGPTFACEKLAELELIVSADTLRRCGVGCSPKASGNGSGGVILIAAVDRVAPALVSWCRSMLQSTTGWRGAASNWC
jgi:hypothetical protein